MAAFVTELDIAYGRAGSRPLLLDLLRPESSPMPASALVWLHGGGWWTGDKRNAIRLHMLDHLAADGFLVASVGIRLSDEARFPAQIHDVKAAIRWLRRSAAALNIDSRRIGIGGFSSGAHLAALAATSGDDPLLQGPCGPSVDPSTVAAAVVIAAPTDFTRNPKAKDPHSTPFCRDGLTPEVRLLGGPVDDCLDLARAANPIAHIGPKTPPMLIMHGTDDEIVPVSQADLLYEGCCARGAFAAYVRVEHGGHDLWDVGTPNPPRPLPPRVEAWMHAFLDEHLRGGAPSGLAGLVSVPAQHLLRPVEHP